MREEKHVQWLANVFTPLGICPILLPYYLELKCILGGILSFDLHNIYTTHFEDAQYFLL
jgi:hypothetical protein